MKKQVAQHKFKAKERLQLYLKCLNILRVSTFNFLIIYLVLISCSDKNIQKQGKIVKADINNNICNDKEYVVPPFSLASTFKAGKPPKVSIANVLFMKNNPNSRRKINNTKFVFLKKVIISYSH